VTLAADFARRAGQRARRGASRLAVAKLTKIVQDRRVSSSAADLWGNRV
jgi:hypothetical protein